MRSRLRGIRRRYKKVKTEKEKTTTFTKLLVSSLTVMAAGWISWSYVLATAALLMYGNVDPLSTVSEEVCRTVIATVIGYCVKSLFENISKYTVTHDTKDVDTIDNPEYYSGGYLDGSEG